MVEAHCKLFYIRANRCASLYDSMFALTGWKKEEINGIEFELNSILVEKWKGKPYRLVIQRQRREDGPLDIWEGEYTYRCILTNDYESSVRDIVEFYNLRGGKERIFDRLVNAGVHIYRARMDCGSCSEEIVSMVESHCKLFYIRANRCASLYDSMFALSGWKKEEINGIEFELNSILVEKWKGKPYNLSSG